MAPNKKRIVFCRIDQKKAAELAGIVVQLDDTELVLFGNPRVGTHLMVAYGSVSIELPLCAVCWKQNNGVYLSVTNLRELKIAYYLSSKKGVLGKISDSVLE